MARLEVRGLSFTYPGAPAATLSNVNFQVAAGGSLALLGSSGAGKTTLLNLLSGLLPSMEGRIEIDGKDVASLGPAYRRVAQVFQFPVLYDSLSVRDNIGFPLRTRGIGKREQHSRAEAIAELFDLRTVLDAKPASLSLFQKQLVGFAKALVRDDLALVLLDEPLTAVEPAMKWRLRGSVKRAQAELGVTMVYVTHDQTEALTFADEVSVLHGGQLLQTATPEELYERPSHSEVARFIGNPGMNVLSAEVMNGDLRVAGQTVRGGLSDLEDGSIELGFRPEWGVLGPSAMGSDDKQFLSLGVSLQAQRLTGASAGRVLGIARVAVGEETAQVACEVSAEPVDQLFLHLSKYRLFRNGWRIESGGIDE